MAYADTQAIVFDFDGVLVESVAVKGRAFVELYKDYGPDVQRQVLDYHLRNGGVSRQEKILYLHSHLLGAIPDNTEIERLSHCFSQLVQEEVINSAWVPGAEDFLKKYSEKIPLFVASATPQHELERIVEARGMRSYFRNVYGSPVKKRQHLQSIAKANGFETEKIVMIGDTISDYNAACEAKTAFIGRLSLEAPEAFPPETAVVSDLLGLESLMRLNLYD